MIVRRRVFAIVLVLCSAAVFAEVAGQNINMVSGTNWPAGDPYLQRQNEPSMAVSSSQRRTSFGRGQRLPHGRHSVINVSHTSGTRAGVYTSMDGGETWKSTLLPGYPQDTSTIGMASPLHAFTAATDATVRAGTHGLFYYSGLAFNRGSNSPSGVFVATF